MAKRKPRFRDIPKFTRSGSYEVDVSLAYLPQHMKTYVEEYGLDMNPDFQRGHVWSEEQQIRFIEFILRGGTSARLIYFNCPHWHNGGREDFVLVDGKQRLEACRRFMENKIPAFGYLYKDYSDKPDMLDARLRFNVNDLKTRAQVLQWYIDLNAGGVVHTTEEIEKVRRLLEEEKHEHS